MGADTSIQWTKHTSNGWHGCEKVDTICKHCYAETQTPIRVKRARGLELWGGNAARSETKGWRSDLRKWNREVTESGGFTPVFAQSLSDTFEDYKGGRVVRADGRVEANLIDLRRDYLTEIEACSALTFQMLTKRPENIMAMVPPWWREKWPAHVWIGTSIGTQESADERIPHLLRVPAAVRFLSVEPQIEAVDLTPWLGYAIRGTHEADRGISWVIQGGESGPKARPFDLAWARSMRDQCKAARVAYFLKQLGARPEDNAALRQAYRQPPFVCHDSHGGDESEWPADLRGCRAFPEAAHV